MGKQAPAGAGPEPYDEGSHEVDLTKEELPERTLSEPAVVDKNLAEQVDEKAQQADISSPTSSVEERRERMRSVLAALVIATIPFIVVVISIGFLWDVFHGQPYEPMRDFATPLLTPLIGISGAILGFYYGESRRT